MQESRQPARSSAPPSGPRHRDRSSPPLVRRSFSEGGCRPPRSTPPSGPTPASASSLRPALRIQPTSIAGAGKRMPSIPRKKNLSIPISLMVLRQVSVSHFGADFRRFSCQTICADLCNGVEIPFPRCSVSQSVSIPTCGLTFVHTQHLPPRKPRHPLSHQGIPEG